MATERAIIGIKAGIGLAYTDGNPLNDNGEFQRIKQLWQEKGAGALTTKDADYVRRAVKVANGLPDPKAGQV